MLRDLLRYPLDKSNLKDLGRRRLLDGFDFRRVAIMRSNSRIFDALGNPVRNTILELLAREPRSVGNIAAAVPVTRSAVSQHLKILKDNGLIQEARSGRSNIYAVVPGALDAISEYVDYIR